MEEAEQTFLAALAADPDDAKACAGYADWLNERGDPRGEYLRLEAQPQIALELVELTNQRDPAWLASVARSCDV